MAEHEDAARQRAIALAVYLTMEMQANRQRMSVMFPERREAFRVLSEEYGMSLRDIARALTDAGHPLSGPRVHEILKGKKRDAKTEDQAQPEA